MARYVGYSVKADLTLFSQIISASVAPEVAAQMLRPEGSVDPSASLFLGSRPMLSFSTHQVGLALAAIGIDGLDVTTALELGFQAREAGGTLSAGGVKASAAKCLIIPRSLRAEQDGLASIEYAAHAYSSDGATAPLSVAASLPTGTPAVAEAFTLGAVTVAGTPLDEVLGFDVDFGLSVEAFKSGGDLYPDLVCIVARSPSITIRLASSAESTTARLAGSEVAVVVNLKKLSITGGGYAGSGDKSITAAKAYLHVQDMSGSPGDAGVVIRAIPRKDGASAILAVA